MKEFKSFDAFTKQMEKIVPRYNALEARAAKFLGKLLAEESKYKIGHLQIGAGPFNTWPDLAESTKNDKQRQGYVFNSEYNPLYRTGDLKNSIGYVFNAATHNLIVGSSSEIAEYQEMGTANIPARSFLGLTMYKEKREIQYILGTFLRDWIVGSNAVLKRR